MNKLTHVFIMAAVLFISSGITNVYADCDNPCGALELLECAAQKEGMTAKQYYNEVLFESETQLDGFCKQSYSGRTGQQKYYYDNFCKQNTGEYYSYENFKEALESGHFAEFCCKEGTTKEQRYKELANFFATIASETTSTMYGYTRDGLYYRYEDGALLGATMQDHTMYYPEDTWKVAALSSDKNLINTQIYWNGSEGEKGNTYYPAESPMRIKWETVSPPSDYEVMKMNEMIDPGYWCGMGATQLTKDTMVGFFGWYYNNIADNKPVVAANYKDFVNNYIVDGKLGFMGTLWYWMYRVSGSGYRTPHQAVTNVDKPVCQDIAGATMMVNGGCNHYPVNRKPYYEVQFIPALLGHDYKLKPVEQEFGGQTLENMTCPWKEKPTEEEKAKFQAYIDAFLGYCRPQ